ncbi:MAG: mannose-6-phosphate isomerase-like protein (cupin superfamily) [Sphingobacteriales bacterium]|jgi:mannose-6-phosphate isomerase-like protein (cupin superfamily)
MDQFKNIEWHQKGLGCREKIIQKGNTSYRLAEFSVGFKEEAPCTLGHQGIVMEGTLTVSFGGKMHHFETGDIIYIPEGTGHEVLVNANPVVVFLIEKK